MTVQKHNKLSLYVKKNSFDINHIMFHRERTQKNRFYRNTSEMISE